MQIVAARNEDAVSYECHDCGHVWKVARPAPPKDNRQR
jgi:DNA-directed RNA polymerase subunit M/transcription elongation factor TFIIS